MLATLGLVMLGSVLAALPLGYGWLLVGRGMQGVGLGLMPLAMTVARDQLPAERSRSTVAILSITASAGVGLGYPLTGLFADSGDSTRRSGSVSRSAGSPWRWPPLVLPGSGHLRRRPLDAPARCCSAPGWWRCCSCLSEGETWGWGSARLLLVALVGVVVVASGCAHELRTPYPLVNLRLMRNRTVLTANATGLFAGLGMYMLLPLVTRLRAGADLDRVRFRRIGRGRRSGAAAVLGGQCLGQPAAADRRPTCWAGAWCCRWAHCSWSASMLIFLFARTQLWEAFLVLGVAGLGTGLIFAAIPGLIMRSVPESETGSALGVNQVVRQIGFSIGSALGAAILTAHTFAPDPLPNDSGYDVSSVVGIALCLFTAVLSFALLRKQADATPIDEARERLLMEESVDGSASGVMLLDTESVEAEFETGHVREKDAQDDQRLVAAGR